MVAVSKVISAAIIMNIDMTSVFPSAQISKYFDLYYDLIRDWIFDVRFNLHCPASLVILSESRPLIFANTTDKEVKRTRNYPSLD
jgi:hypothetical protein